jgi:hypothetical protein
MGSFEGPGPIARPLPFLLSIPNVLYKRVLTADRTAGTALVCIASVPERHKAYRQNVGKLLIL